MSESWTVKDKIGFWIKVVGLALAFATAMSTCGLATGRWVYTRASTDEVDAVEKNFHQELSYKEDKSNAEKERGKLERKIDVQFKLLRNVSDNVIRLMSHQRVEPVQMEVPKPEAVP